MTQRNRLATGGRIDRGQPLGFTFNGKRYEGYRGDTVASALLANGVHLVGRSFKYHRPRGIVGSGQEEPNALLQIGPCNLPNYRATEFELQDGLVARSVNCWPSARFDVGALIGLFSRFMPPGFYYKTFMWPRRLWPTYERLIRRAAGLGTSPKDPDRDTYDRFNAHCDVLVTGGGPAGLAAALEAGRTGARVILADEQTELGGSLLKTRDLIDGAPAMEWAAGAIEEMVGMEEVRLLTRTTVVGYYDHNFLTLLERRTDHLPPSGRSGPRERLWRVRAKQVVVATGAIERPLVFPNNDRPGVMLASAVSTYLIRYGVAAGSRAVLFTNNDSAYQTALDLADAGVPVASVVDVRSEPSGELPAQVRQRGIEVIGGHVVIDVKGKMRAKGVQIMALDSSGEGVQDPTRRISCDLLAVSGGWSPSVHLHAQSGGKPTFDVDRACFLPGKSVQAERSAGASNGAFTLGACLQEGSASGAAAAQAAGFGDGRASAATPATVEVSSQAIRPMWLVPARKPVTREHKQFVDLQEDVSAADIVIASREGYDSIGLLNRYTTLGFGTDQGKLGNVNGMGILAETLGQDIRQTGTTTFRPLYTPVTIGAIAGRNIGRLADPVRKTPIHGWHEEHGAEFENVGQWKRPWYYPRDGESMEEAVRRECRAARTGVAMLDQSTLGKIDIQGPDAARFLNRVYTNAWTKLGIGRCRYGLMLGEDGMVMDDGVTARFGESHLLIHTTSGGAANVYAWLERWLQTEWPKLRVYMTSVTEHWATPAIIGPRGRDVIKEICPDIDFSNDAFPFMSFREGTVAGVPARVFRVSFSGELTYEVNVPADHGRAVWEAIIDAGEKYGITPYGTETMHVLRAEKGFIITGQDTDGSVNPIDLGMDWIVSKRKDFLGRRSLSRPDSLREDRKQMVGLLAEDPTEMLPEGAQIVEDPRGPIPMPMIGHVTSNYFSVPLDRTFALALLKGASARMGDTVYLPLAGGRTARAEITNPVFYDPEGKRQSV